MTTIGQMATPPANYQNPAVPLAGFGALYGPGAMSGYLNTGGSTNQGQLQDALAWIKQYDPNASITTTPGASYSNESGQGTMPDTYGLSYDVSKLPKPSAQLAQQIQAGSGHAGGGPVQGFTDANGNLISPTGYTVTNPHAYFNDPTYGTIASPKAYQQNTPSEDKWGTIGGQLFASAVMAGMGGGLASALGGGLGGTLGQFGFSQGMNALQGGSFNPMSLVNLIGGQIPGVSSIAPYLQAGNTAYQASKGNYNPAENMALGQMAKYWQNGG